MWLLQWQKSLIQPVLEPPERLQGILASRTIRKNKDTQEQVWTLRGRLNSFVFVKNKLWVSKKETIIPVEYLNEVNFTLDQEVALRRVNTQRQKMHLVVVTVSLPRRREW